MYQVKMFYEIAILYMEREVNRFLIEHPNIIIEKIVQNDGENWTTLTILYKTD